MTNDVEKIIERYLFDISLLTELFSDIEILNGFLLINSVIRDKITPTQHNHLLLVKERLNLNDDDFSGVLVLIREIYLAEMLFRPKN